VDAVAVLDHFAARRPFAEFQRQAVVHHHRQAGAQAAVGSRVTSGAGVEFGAEGPAEGEHGRLQGVKQRAQVSFDLARQSRMLGCRQRLARRDEAAAQGVARRRGAVAAAESVMGDVLFSKR
jgi:hypothetical protein